MKKRIKELETEVKRLTKDLEDYKGIWAYKTNVMDLDLGEVFIYKGRMWTVVIDKKWRYNTSRRSYIVAKSRGYDGKFLVQDFTFNNNPEVTSVDSSAF